MGKVIVHGELSRQGEHQYLQQLQFFAHWFRDLLPLFSIRELPYRELLSGICVLKRLFYSQIKNSKHYFDWDFPQSRAMTINYFAQGLHWTFGGKEEIRTRNTLKIPLGMSI
jgi:hypothetical protein